MKHRRNVRCLDRLAGLKHNLCRLIGRGQSKIEYIEEPRANDRIAPRLDQQNPVPEDEAVPWE